MLITYVNDGWLMLDVVVINCVIQGYSCFTRIIKKPHALLKSNVLFKNLANSKRERNSTLIGLKGNGYLSNN